MEDRAMSDSDGNDRPYPVGYKKPPMETRFKKGHVGRPRGKAVARKSLLDEVLDQLQEMVDVTDNGKRRKMRTQTFGAKRFVAGFMKGDAKARGQLIQLLNQSRPNSPPNPPPSEPARRKGYMHLTNHDSRGHDSAVASESLQTARNDAVKSALNAPRPVSGNAEKSLAHIRARSGDKSLLRGDDVREERVGDSFGGLVVKGGSGPLDASLSWRPNPEDRAMMWEGEPPLFDDTWHRKVYDMNKEFTDYLRGCIAIEVPGYVIVLPRRNTLRHEKHGS